MKHQDIDDTLEMIRARLHDGFEAAITILWSDRPRMSGNVITLQDTKVGVMTTHVGLAEVENIDLVNPRITSIGIC